MKESSRLSGPEIIHNIYVVLSLFGAPLGVFYTMASIFFNSMEDSLEVIASWLVVFGALLVSKKILNRLYPNGKADEMMKARHMLLVGLGGSCFVGFLPRLALIFDPHSLQLVSYTLSSFCTLLVIFHFYFIREAKKTIKITYENRRLFWTIAAVNLSLLLANLMFSTEEAGFCQLLLFPICLSTSIEFGQVFSGQVKFVEEEPRKPLAVYENQFLSLDLEGGDKKVVVRGAQVHQSPIVFKV